jgi:hypothetical protein
MKRRFELEPGEEILGEWVAGLPSSSGRTASYGGTLVLTDRRLLWEAVRLPPGIDRIAGGFLQEMVSGVPLASVRAARPDPDRPAMLVIHADGGESRFLIAASRMSPIWSKKNRAARDDAAARVSAALGG